MRLAFFSKRWTGLRRRRWACDGKSGWEETHNESSQFRNFGTASICNNFQRQCICPDLDAFVDEDQEG